MNRIRLQVKNLKDSSHIIENGLKQKENKCPEREVLDVIKKKTKCDELESFFRK